MNRACSFLVFVLILTISVATPAPAEKLIPNGGWNPSWSPDSSTIAFSSGTPHGIPNLWVMKADGTEARRLITRGAHAPVWLPDGKSIVFGTIRSGEPSYMSIDASGQPNSEKPVEALPLGAEDPVWSPDGSLVAYGITNADGKTRDVWFNRTSGGGVSGLSSKFWVREWAWSPDGTALALVIGRSVGTSLWVVTTKDREMRLAYRGFCKSPAYSPDGKRLAIAVPDVRSAFKIRVINLESGTDKLIGVQTFGGDKITWSPDGSRFFFASARKSEPAVWTVRADAKDLRRLTPEGLPAREFSLSPDGKKIAFQAMGKDSYSPELYVCDVSGGNIAKLTQTSHSYWSPVWSPNGKKLAYESDVKHFHGLYTAAPSGRGKIVARPMNPNPTDVSWFPDSRRLLLGDAGAITAVDTVKPKLTAKLFSPEESIAAMPGLSADRVYFTEYLNTGYAGISSITWDGKDKRILTKGSSDQPATQPEKDAQPQNDPQPANTVSLNAPEGVLVASTEFYVAQHPAPKAESNTEDKTGNPHSGLGLMGPQVDVATPEKLAPPVIDLSPAVSPDGKLVVFVRDNLLWLIGCDGTNEKQLTQFQASGTKRLIASPSWSPGGDAILFHCFSKQDSKIKLEIWLSGTEAGSERCIYSEHVDSEYSAYYDDCTNPPAFTPDGQRIIFTSIAGDEPRIASIAADGSGFRELIPAPSAFPSIDRTGRKLAYVDLTGSLERIRILDLTSGKRTRALFR